MSNLNRFFIIFSCVILGASIFIIAKYDIFAPKKEISGRSEIIKTDSQGKANIGGNFSLTNQNEIDVTDKDYQGKYKLINFGFTHCPDVCPTSMQKIAQTLEILSNKSDNLYPIFISVDPQRDTPKELKSFLNEFDNRIIGLTGKSEEIKKVAKEYKIYYSKNYLDIDENDHEHNHHNHYLIDHTALFYLMDENGEYVKYYPNNITPEEMAKDIASYL